MPKFKLVQAFMIFLFIHKNEEDPSKNEGTKLQFLGFYIDF